MTVMVRSLGAIGRGSLVRTELKKTLWGGEAGCANDYRPIKLYTGL